MCVVKESFDAEEEDAEQERKEDDAAATVLGRGHCNAVLANHTEVSFLSFCPVLYALLGKTVSACKMMYHKISTASRTWPCSIISCVHDMCAPAVMRYLLTAIPIIVTSDR